MNQKVCDGSTKELEENLTRLLKPLERSYKFNIATTIAEKMEEGQSAQEIASWLIEEKIEQPHPSALVALFIQTFGKQDQEAVMHH